jgi:hypothetical protein
MSNYCIVQEGPTEQQHILGLLLSIELYDKGATCIVCCSAQTQAYINAFPKTLALNLDFLVLPLDVVFTPLEYLKNSWRVLHYGVTTYTDCLFVNKELIMTNPLLISAAVKAQGIGFIEKTIQTEKEFQRYSLSLLYIREPAYVHLIKQYYETALHCPDFLTFVLPADTNEPAAEDKPADNKKAVLQVLLQSYADLPLFLKTHLQLEVFLPPYSYVGTEDFFAFENPLKIDQISKTLSLQQHLIAFCNIRTDTLDKKIQQLNNYFLNSLVNKHVVYMSLLNLKMSGNKLQFIVPKRNGVGIWDRTQDKGGLYELIAFWAETYPQYLSKVEVDIDYFSFGNYVLTDKPSHIWLNNSIKKYSGLALCNYDPSLQSALPALPLPATFLFYYAYYPVQLAHFLAAAEPCEKTIDAITVTKNTGDDHFTVCYAEKKAEKALALELEKEVVDFCSLLTLLRKVNYGVMEILDANLLATYLALGVVPILPPTLVPFDLTENVHYLTQKPATDDGLAQLQQQCLTYYRDQMQPPVCLQKLLHFVFVRDIEGFHVKGHH